MPHLPAGIRSIGFEGEGFCFDNEQPAHQELLREGRIARNLVTNGEWLEFMADGGYTTPIAVAVGRLGDGRGQGWDAPGYWRSIDGAMVFADAGRRAPDRSRGAGAARELLRGRRLCALGGTSTCRPRPNGRSRRAPGCIDDAFGVAWQWTRSAYLPYPGYRAAEGALGEYNGKFMVNQMVLRGSSLATPDGHARPSYRNFFPPPARWQFSGLRLVDYR